MQSTSIKRLVLCALALTVILACNVPGVVSNAAPDTAGTMVVQTLSAMQTLAAVPSNTAAPAGPSAAPPPALPPAATATAKAPVVKLATLCWKGPGDAYEVVSSVQPGIELKVMGVGSIGGWLIVENPRYHDPCWIEMKNLTLDPNFSTVGLRVFNPPPTPGPTATEIPTPTPV